ncbi:nuclear transport factor 2 family protein [Actinomadura luteofluorescens]|uniref:nuclear transport factor 2 family protein n=1 Tax=Actinomadura luteofluorescens TaxID=46163 RepID=UPI003D8D7A52
MAEWTSRGAARGGSAYDNRCLGVFTVRNGKITCVREKPTPSTSNAPCSTPRVCLEQASASRANA